MPNLVKILLELFPSVVKTIFFYSATNSTSFLFIVITERSTDFFNFLKSSYFARYSYFIDEFASDSIFSVKRFRVYTYLRSFYAQPEVIILEPISFFRGYTSALESIYVGSAWAEREIFDIYGILFSNHSDLRRILTDYGFEGYPLRKDFPVSGYTQIRFDEAIKRIITEPLELAQEYRYFEFNNPWSGKNG